MAAITRSIAQGGARVPIDWHYRRAYDPAAIVDVPAPA